MFRLPGNGSRSSIYQRRVDRRADGRKDQDQHASRDIGFANAMTVIDGKGAWPPSHRLQENDCRAMDNRIGPDHFILL